MAVPSTREAPEISASLNLLRDAGSVAYKISILCLFGNRKDHKGLTTPPTHTHTPRHWLPPASAHEVGMQFILQFICVFEIK